MSDIILSVKDLKVHFPIRSGLPMFTKTQHVKAVDGVTFDLYKGETLGLVGESGCGKSTLGRAILRLIQPTSGEVLFEGQDLAHLSHAKLQLQRRYMQMIFQDPFSSLNPRMTIEDIVAEPLRTFNIVSGQELRRKVQDLLRMVGMDPRYIRRYPHEFSGGQCQRIGIARALALNPKIIVADEPISALDVSIQAQILNLMETLQKELGLTYIFIAHDLAAVHHISDRIAVMYLGKIVELSDAETIIRAPKHPYTQALIQVAPIPNPKLEKQRKHVVLKGDVPSPLNPPSGCTFHPRCPIAVDRCKSDIPELRDLTTAHKAACHLV
ncbi:MAG: dipeptide ABC transporter ATP-binding protein [Proteobacteria bacterium]|jgi:oligopeptide transport system ATP-binding protein|nr:dipeptide ABC transporter ATP-binding protein [Pseudomonadota bacterium]